MERTIPMSTKPECLLALTGAWPNIPTLREAGFVQTSTSRLPVDPFVVQVSLPFYLSDGVPFYLHVRDQHGQFEILISEETLVDTLLSFMGSNRQQFYWAEVMKGGQINFDTITECPGW